MSAERFTLDTNVLVNSINSREAAKRGLALQIVAAAVRLDCPLALQAIGEFHVASVAKLKLAPKDAAARAGQLLTSFETFSHSASAMRAALDEAAKGRFSFWDALILASAAEAGCTTILSEDMADGARFGSIAVCNPFSRGGGLSAGATALLGE